MSEQFGVGLVNVSETIYQRCLHTIRTPEPFIGQGYRVITSGISMGLCPACQEKQGLGSTAALRSQLAAAEADRATWQQRATSAEAERDRLRGEAALLHAVIDRLCYTADGLADSTGCSCEGEKCWSCLARQEVKEARTDLRSTPRAAKLGRLIDAALAWKVAFDNLSKPGWEKSAGSDYEEAQERLEVTADDVLAE